jgi:phosphoglycolate phosphatase
MSPPVISPRAIGYTVVFDLDGTLIDTAPDLVATLNFILVREGLRPLAYAAARNFVGGGARVMIERGLKAEQKTRAPADLDRLLRDFIEHYGEHIAEGSRLFPGVEDALDELVAGGFRLAVCTNKLEWLALRLLDQFDLTRRFDAICGADTFGVAKPDPHILRETIARAGGSRDRCVLVGDSVTDISTARAAGVPVVAVDFGYSETPIAQLRPDRIVSRFADLPEAVRALLDQRTG